MNDEEQFAIQQPAEEEIIDVCRVEGGQGQAHDRHPFLPVGLSHQPVAYGEKYAGIDPAAPRLPAASTSAGWRD